MGTKKSRGGARSNGASAGAESGGIAEPASAARVRGNKPTGEIPSQVDLQRAGEWKSSIRPQSSAVERLPVVGDSAVTIGAAASDIGSFIRAQREAAEVSIRQLAERAGVSNPYLSQIERGLRKPSAEVLSQIAKGLRLSAEVLYVRAGILEQREASLVRDAVLTAPELSERQREVLLEIYEAFLASNSANADLVVDVAT